MKLKYPLLVIDIESSGLDPACYPIEIGLARRITPTAEIELFETLVRPTTAWANDHPWMMTAQRVHGISKNDLNNAPDVSKVVNALMNWIGKDRAIISDNPFFDQRWLTMLFEAADAKFIPYLMWPDHIDREAFHQHTSKVAHRAGEDAVSILQRLEAILTKEQDA